MPFPINKKEDFWWLTKEVVREVFQVSLIAYLVFYLIEDFKVGFITNYFNLNILLILTIISGIITVLLEEKETSFGEGYEEKVPEEEKIKKRDYIFIIILGIIAAIIIFFRIKSLGWLAPVISIISGIIIIMISILLLWGKEEKEEDRG